MIETIIHILIINYIFVLIIYNAHIYLKYGYLNREGLSRKNLLMLLIPFWFLICIVYLLIIFIKDKIQN